MTAPVTPVATTSTSLPTQPKHTRNTSSIHTLKVHHTQDSIDQSDHNTIQLINEDEYDHDDIDDMLDDQHIIFQHEYDNTSDHDTDEHSVSDIPTIHTDSNLIDPNFIESDPMYASTRAVELARQDTSDKQYRVYCDGVFDLFHLGHMRMLEQAKNSLGSRDKIYLIAGVCSDELVHKYKGKTVMNHQVRCDSVSHCKHVDLVAGDAPWVITDEFINKYQIDFVAHDAIPYSDTTGTANSASDVYAHIKQRGMFLTTQRTDGISTSDIIVEIVKGYDDFVRRNLARGYSKKDLNVGLSWEIRSRFHDSASDMYAARELAKQQFIQTESAIKSFITQFNPRKAGALKYDDMHGKTIFTPRAYVQHIKSTLPIQSKSICYHSLGLTKAIYHACISTLAYINPFQCCFRCRRNSKKDE